MSGLTCSVFVLGLVSPFLLASSCPPRDSKCPTPPSTADWGPVPPMAGQSSVDIELDRLYVIARVRGMLEQPQTGGSGAFVRGIDLKELSGPGGQRLSVIQIRLEPWIKGGSGQPVSFQRFYDLTLRATPHLITPATVPDAARRRQLLCAPGEESCTRDQGVWLTFDLHELKNVSFGRLACTTPDLIDIQVVPEIYANIGKQRPLSLPTDAIADVLSKAAGGVAIPTDVNVAMDGFLKIGLRFDGPVHAFDGTAQLLSHFPGGDWMVDIDKNILAASVRAKMLAELVAKASGTTLTSFTATFTPGEIITKAVAALPVPGICGTTATVNIDVRSPMKICRDSTGTSTIVAYQEITDQSPNLCIKAKQFWDGIGVGIISGPPAVWPTLAKVSFPAGVDDVFYATDLDLNNAFAIVGRSTVMDRRAAAAGAPRPPAPAKCPGMP